jgi:hypothetical protein
LFKDGSFNK